MHLQFCDRAANRDITGDFYAEQDATEVRAWDVDGTLLGAVQRTSRGLWRVIGSDVTDWTRKAYKRFGTFGQALAALGVNVADARDPLDPDGD